MDYNNYAQKLKQEAKSNLNENEKRFFNHQAAEDDAYQKNREELRKVWNNQK